MHSVLDFANVHAYVLTTTVIMTLALFTLVFEAFQFYHKLSLLIYHSWNASTLHYITHKQIYLKWIHL